jgi:alkylated DNA repair dioxygenase AlkB
MAQLALFQSGPRLLVEDEPGGRITYQPDLVPAVQARAWFEALRADVPWKHERRRMYDREVDVPRLLASYRLDRPGLPEAIVTAEAAVRAATGVRFNGVGLNFYRDGADSVAPHNDHLYELVPGFPIALLSLGSVREMVIRAKQPPRRVLRVGLEPGSLLVMSYATQQHFDHGIPKTKAAVGPRISLAFRVKPDASSRY